MSASTWRVGHEGRDMMFYEERYDGAWRRLEIQGEMLLGPASHVIYFDSPTRWQQYPEWARHRRDEIIARIVSEFRAPDYEYNGLDRATAVSAPQAGGRNVGWTASSVAPSDATASQTRALTIAIVVVLLIACAMVWVVIHGVSSGTTRLPVPRVSQLREIHRAESPALFWTSIGLHASVGILTLALGLWGIRQRARA